jgi:hypothetical protein
MVNESVNENTTNTTTTTTTTATTATTTTTTTNTTTSSSNSSSSSYVNNFVTVNNLVSGSTIFQHKTLRKLWNSLYGNTINKVDHGLLICRSVFKTKGKKAT